jgi:signal transduction histidine kinase
MDGENEERYHKLENAIEMLSPAEDDQKLYTGDAELAGLETAVNKLMARMRDSYRQQARFVSDASHELRTPIAVIKGYADLLDRWGKTDEKILEESIQAIKDESENMQHLVEQLLFLARGDSGRTTLNISDFDISDMMKEVCEESAMIDDKHQYRFESGGSIPARGDVSLIKQAARILIENASKYTPEGGEIKLRSLVSDGHPAFSVQDSGIGISESDIPHIFDRFYRADDSRSKQTGGSGLGLAIAKWIVERHGGRFEVISRKDIGTRITVIFS